MRRTLLRIFTALQLTRLTMAYGAIADLWLVILLTRVDPLYENLPASTLPLPVSLFAGLVVAVGLFTFGAGLNDVLDARHDRAFSPDRPIPAGNIRPQQAAILTSACLAAATLGAATLGVPAVATMALTALGIIFYNAFAKHVPSVGFVTIGLVHAVHMAIPNHLFSFTLPIWLSMTHAMAVAILVYKIEDKRPTPTVRAWMFTLAGWSFWSAVVLSWGWWHSRGVWPLGNGPWPGCLWPLGTALAFVGIAVVKTKGQSPAVASEKLRRYGAMWQSLYAVSWFAAIGLWKEALMLGGVAAGGFAVMTALKEITIAIRAPRSWREA
ncbi:MAG: UbiA family prenyltransferase [Phycisphaerae bacterium]|nr:UbiA family prenyltransferase [Phycisphaerae bacterium]